MANFDFWDRSSYNGYPMNLYLWLPRADVPGVMFSMSMLVVKLLMTVDPANTKAMLYTKVGLPG